MSIREDIIEQRAMQVRQAWDAILRQPEGRLAVWSILEGCHLFGQTHFGNDLDGFRAGQRDIGLGILRDRVFPHGSKTFTDMQIEHADLIDRLEAAAERDAANAEKENSDE
ncbi:hypothetical protein [Paracoccus homiensis]|uniref:Uncharacterized protein n=1 Tax=Paracoccus homiensis TaxID=364199 RepID=A0A1I0GVI3_9RHOB|nr:hypothetical protein [Paracoccus homiensis]SET75227.1 hypothetical protein SAMN04489858_109104 [Paracoccus homiensis]